MYEFRVVLVSSNADATMLEGYLDKGWTIDRSNSTNECVVYILSRIKDGEV